MLSHDNAFFVLHKYVLMLQAMRFPACDWLPSSDYPPERGIRRAADSMPDTQNEKTAEVTDVLG